MPFIIILITLLSSLSCSNIKQVSKFDTATNLSRSGFKNTLLEPRGSSELNIKNDDKKELESMKFRQMLLSPPKPKIAANKLITLSVTEDVPIKDILIELARLADVEIEIDPNITGGVILMVKDRPFDDVIASIADMTNLKIEVSNGILKVKKDAPYIVNYDLKFLDISRSNTSSLSISTSTGSDEITSGGESSISATTDGDLWTSILDNIEQMITVASFAGETDNSSFVTVNKQAGIISVQTFNKKHMIVRDYLDTVRKNSTAQVLIEAKIVEVDLSDEFRTGVDWTGVSNLNESGNGFGNYNAGTSSTMTSPFEILATNSGEGAFSATLSMLEEFGTTRTLSSPRITAINNQQAVLSFFENDVYFEVTYDESSTTDDSTTTTVSIDSEVQTIPIGIILTLLPSINLDTNEILMNIRPTITTYLTSIEDPAVTLTAAALDADSTVTSEIPEVDVREIDTVMKLYDGQTMIMGGLIEQSDAITENGVPFLKDIPLLGFLFKSYEKELKVTETVILLKATIITPDTQIDENDRKFYETFTTDPRPFIF